jgi:quercetin dioxygenase-like cupin family protein
VNNVAPRHTFTYGENTLNVYHADKGEGVVRHEHAHTHGTMCTSGKLLVTKEYIAVELTKESLPVILKANEWHEIEALEDGTVFINIFATTGVSL